MGLIHIYHGTGKGKTTAAVGLAVRSFGAGHKVLFQQYLKDGTSSELKVLESLGIEVQSGMPEEASDFLWNLTDKQKAVLKDFQNNRAKKALAWAREMRDVSGGLLVMDETLASLEFKVLDFSLVEEISKEIHSQGNGPDLVLTGRNPSEELLAYADYITNMAMERHPFEQGKDARLGIEF